MNAHGISAIMVLVIVAVVFTLLCLFAAFVAVRADGSTARTWYVHVIELAVI